MIKIEKNTLLTILLFCHLADIERIAEGKDGAPPPHNTSIDPQDSFPIKSKLRSCSLPWIRFKGFKLNVILNK